MEPSECGEEVSATGTVSTQIIDDLSKEESDTDSHFPPPPTEYLNAPVNVDNVLNANNRVSIISHQLEESYGSGPSTYGSATLGKKKIALFRSPQQAVSEHDTVG